MDENGIELELSNGGHRKIRTLHNEELHSFYCSPNIIIMAKLRRIRWVKHNVKHGGEMHTGFSQNLGYTSIEQRLILKWM